MRRPFIVAAFALPALAAALCMREKPAQSADHLDSPAVRLDPTVDIADQYAWMDGNNYVIVMTSYPVAMATTKFSDKVQYVFHTASGAFPSATTPYDIICTFNTAQVAQCWGGTNEYVTGDASAATGITSADGKFKVFAGPRADPFFFNLEGFKHAVATVEGAASGLTFDPAGCPALSASVSAALVNMLQTDKNGGPPVDFFATLNALAIVVSIDKSLVTTGGTAVTSWVGTYK